MITVTAINGRPQAQLPFQTEASDMLARPQPALVLAGTRACGRNGHSIDLFGLVDKVPDRGGSVRHALDAPAWKPGERRGAAKKSIVHRPAVVRANW